MIQIYLAQYRSIQLSLNVIFSTHLDTCLSLSAPHKIRRQTRFHLQLLPLGQDSVRIGSEKKNNVQG